MGNNKTVYLRFYAFAVGWAKQSAAQLLWIVGPHYIWPDLRAEKFQNLLKKYGMGCSMSRKGNCWDNAVCESFMGSLKVEEVDKKVYKTMEDARVAIFDYIEGFYNRTRLHSFLNYTSPNEFEKIALAA